MFTDCMLVFVPTKGCTVEVQQMFVNSAKIWGHQHLIPGMAITQLLYHFKLRF